MRSRLRSRVRSTVREHALTRQLAYSAKRLLSTFRPGNVVMFHIGRSGSTVLGNMLDQRPDVLWGGEIYERAIQRWENLGWPIDNLAPPFEPLAYLRKQMVYAGRRYYGLEVKPFHLRAMNVPFADFIPALTSLGFAHFVVLRRRNLLKTIVSSTIANTNRQFHQAIGQEPTLTRITLDVQHIGSRSNRRSLLELLELNEADLCAAEQAVHGLNVLHLTYEDDIEQDPFVAYRKVCDFVGMKPHDVTISFGKTNPFPLRDILVNFDEVHRTLRGTPYEWMLDE